MIRELHTDAEVQAVPLRTVVRAHDGTIAARFDDEKGVVFGLAGYFPWNILRAPAQILWLDGQPDAVPLSPSVVDARTSGSGAAAIADERQRQIDEEGYTPEHDLEHHGDDLIFASIAYLHAARAIPRHVAVQWWPWPDGFKPQTQSPPDYPRVTDRRDLIKAGALIAAAIDRLDQVDR